MRDDGDAGHPAASATLGRRAGGARGEHRDRHRGHADERSRGGVDRVMVMPRSIREKATSSGSRTAAVQIAIRAPRAVKWADRSRASAK